MRAEFLQLMPHIFLDVLEGVKTSRRRPVVTS